MQVADASLLFTWVLPVHFLQNSHVVVRSLRYKVLINNLPWIFIVLFVSDYRNSFVSFRLNFFHLPHLLHLPHLYNFIGTYAIFIKLRVVIGMLGHKFRLWLWFFTIGVVGLVGYFMYFGLKVIRVMVFFVVLVVVGLDSIDIWEFYIIGLMVIMKMLKPLPLIL